MEWSTLTRQLPPTLRPRLISREVAAKYIGVSPNTFDAMVEDGRMPRAKVVSPRRHAWDVWALDDAVDRLPSEGEDTPDDTWGDVDAAQTPSTR